MAAASKFNSVVTNPGGTGSTITPVLSTHASGDEIEIFVSKTGNAAWSAPAGWTIRHQTISPGTASTATVGTLLYRRVLPGDTLPLANPVCNLAATVTRHAIARTIRSADVEGVYTLPEWSATGSTSGTNNPIRPPSVTTPAPEMFVTHYYCQRVATNAPEPTGYTQDQQVITSGTLVTNISERTVADQQTVLANQDVSPTSGGRWVGMISCVPSPDYPYYRSGSQAFNANATSVTPALPAGTSSNDNRGNKDLVILTAQCAGVAPTVNTPAHWTLISEWSNTTSGGVTTVRKWRAVYTGTLDRQVNRTPSGEIFAYLSVYHNAHQTIPVGTSAVQQNASSTTSTFPALPRTGTKATVQATCVADGTQTFTAPSGWTERNDSQGVTCADQSFNATGTTASASFTLNSASPTLAGLMEVFSVASVINLILTPTAVVLTTTRFAPKLVLTITPPAASLSLTTFAPTVTTEAAQQYYRSLTIDADLVPNTDQTDFPVLVSFTDVDLKSVSNGGHVASESGFDILFFSDAALTTQLAHELRKYDPATGELIAHVKLSNVSHSSDTVFYVKYGDAAITSSQEDVADVWSNGFLGVWHLDGASLGTAKNSVTGGDSTVSGPVAGVGQIDGGADFTGGAATDSILTDLAVTQPAAATYEIWSRREGEGGNSFGRMWVKGSVTNSVLQFFNDAITYAPDEVYIFSVQWDGPSVVGNWSIPRPSADAWHSLAVTYNNSSAGNDPLIYLNGAPATVTERITPSGALVDDAAERFAIGQRHITLNRKWDGLLDEFRVSSVIRSPDWIELRFNNESNAAFIDVGVELEVGDVLLTPAPAMLTTTRFAPVLQLRVTPTTAALTLTTFAPSVTVIVTVPAASLTLTTFAPTVDVSADVSVTPTTATLTLTSFAVQLREVVTAASQSLVLTSFVPKLAEVVTPGNASLSLTTFAPTLATNTILTPAAVSLTLTRFAPVLVERVTPQTATLALTTFAPIVIAEADVTVVPATATLALTGFAPQLHERLTPSAASLVITTFAPEVTISADITVSPTVATLTLTTFTPPLRLMVTPDVSSLVLSTFAPTITVSADRTVEPLPASLVLQAFASQLRLVLTPATATLALSTFAPTVTTGAGAGVTVTPATRLLTLTTYAPLLLTSRASPRRTFVVESTRRTVIIERSSRTLFVSDGNREKTMV